MLIGVPAANAGYPDAPESSRPGCPRSGAASKTINAGPGSASEAFNFDEKTAQNQTQEALTPYSQVASQYGPLPKNAPGVCRLSDAKAHGIAASTEPCSPGLCGG